jgi:cobalt/nickel transport system permease protein
MKNKIHELYALERLSGGGTCIHRLHPLVKLLVSAVFLLTVVSFNRYAVARLVPYIFYPMLMTALSETPYQMLIKRFFIALPFCLFAGISNVIVDNSAVLAIASITVSSGFISLITILFKTYLCVMAVLILISVTPFYELSGALRQLRIPRIFITMFEMTYRYIGVLAHEAYSMGTAYSLRSRNRKGIEMRDMGSFAGLLLIRSVDRADRVYNAMKCRGYTPGYNPDQSMAQKNKKLGLNDLAFAGITLLLCATFRFFDLIGLFAGFLERFL